MMGVGGLFKEGMIPARAPTRQVETPKQRTPRDIAHVLLAVAQGLSSQESAGWLGTSPVTKTGAFGALHALSWHSAGTRAIPAARTVGQHMS